MQELHGTGASEISVSQILDPDGVHHRKFQAHSCGLTMLGSYTRATSSRRAFSATDQ